LDNKVINIIDAGCKHEDYDIHINETNTSNTGKNTLNEVFPTPELQTKYM
jgi:hypothetical protein